MYVKITVIVALFGLKITRCKFLLPFVMTLFLTFKEKNSAWSSFVPHALKRFTIPMVNKILILRQRNLSKHCLLRFLCLNIKIPPLHVQQSTSKTT